MSHDSFVTHFIVRTKYDYYSHYICVEEKRHIMHTVILLRSIPKDTIGFVPKVLLLLYFTSRMTIE